MDVVLIFPHQLFEEHPALKRGLPVVLVEDRRFFSDFAFHKKKLVLHRASLKHFEYALKKKGFKTTYIEGDLEEVFDEFDMASAHFCELHDFTLSKRIQTVAKRKKVKLELYPTPGFLTQVDEFSESFKGKKHLSCQTFYIDQRKKLDLLLDKQGKPIGGKWSYDTENRRKLPKGVEIPRPPKFTHTKELKEAIGYIEKKYPKNPGSCEGFNYPVTHLDAKRALTDFLAHRLHDFGEYEDAIAQDEEILFHSCLSPLINIGLLTPAQVADETIAFSSKHKVPINSLEGFIRQLVGWREFVGGVYYAIGEKQREGNFFKHHNKITRPFYEGSTGIPPIDTTIKKLLKTGYLHHIERLMLLGNFFLLCEISPDEIYRWFMELFIDSYDWVMVPNVYGMSQYADGGRMTTKPYFSGSNYVLKMSDYKKGEWCKVWDALFWRFFIKHEKFFQNQPRLQVLCQLAKKKKSDRELLKIGEDFLKNLFGPSSKK